MDKYLPAPTNTKAKKPRKPRAPKAPGAAKTPKPPKAAKVPKAPKPPKAAKVPKPPKPAKVPKPPKPAKVPKPKMPSPAFNSTDEFHAYLESLTHPQLKKVATALVSKTKKLLSVDKTGSREELLEDIKDTFEYSDVDGGLVIPKVGIFKNDLPKQKQPKEKLAERIDPVNEEDYPTQAEISDERTRRQVIGKMRIIEQTNNDIFIIRHKNKLNKTKNPTTSQEERRSRAEDYIREKTSPSVAAKLITRAYQKYK
jgi:hypothetical protein